jgi:hypothetical protein
LGDVIEIRSCSVAQLEDMLAMALACGKKSEASRHVLFKCLCAARDGVNTALSPFITAEQRDATLRIVQQHLNAVVAAGCPRVEWPEQV